jgi:hypothetical protein
MKTKQVHFRSYNYEKIEKKQIYLHHTAGGPSGEQVFQYWESQANKVATCVAISNDGNIVQGFGSECWEGVIAITRREYVNGDHPGRPLSYRADHMASLFWG